MKRQFYPQNEPVKYAESLAEVDEWASVSAPGSIIMCLTADGMKAYMVNSDKEAIEL